MFEHIQILFSDIVRNTHTVHPATGVTRLFLLLLLLYNFIHAYNMSWPSSRTTLWKSGVIQLSHLELSTLELSTAQSLPLSM